ncbi:MAG TPA: protein phosphatase 2C domain-containing protein [Ktedonobacteraceae bacterium]|nr:protein phosphatase 2C domain-containing protein [Ktedonobacteraceae bacterium]
MICPLCHTQNREDAKFCKGCGQPLRAEPAHAGGDVVMSNAVPAGPAPATPEALAQGNAEEAPARTGETTSTTSQPQADEPQSGQAPAGGTIEDITNAPTLVLTPERMMAIHNRRWQQEAEQAQGEQAAMPFTPDYAEMPSTPAQNEQDIAEAPTVMMHPNAGAGLIAPPQGYQAGSYLYASNPSQEDEPIPAPPPPPPSSFSTPQAGDSQVPTAGAPEATESGAEADSEKERAGLPVDANVPPTANEAGSAGETTTSGAGTGESLPAPVDQPSQASSNTSGQSGTEQEAAPSSEFPLLELGAIVADRYKVTQVVGDGEKEHVYQVVDLQGYQHCWNCDSEENAEGDEFCINCGAELLNVPYLMHEYPAAPAGKAGDSAADTQDAHVLQGTIANTVVEKGHTYVIEQPQAEQNAFPNGVRLLAACDSDAGNVRRSEPNEDSTLVLLLQRVFESTGTPTGVFIVADGLGGHDNGQVASRTTINIIAERMVRELLAAPLSAEKNGETVKPFDEDTLVALFHDAIQDANTVLCQKNQQDKTDMGSTITGFMIVGDHAYIINVGDSRTYMLRGQQLYQLTTDHSLVGQLVASGLIEPDDVYTHPQRSQIFRSLGDKLNVQIDMFKQQLHPGDILLSCSDGLWEMVRNPQIESTLNNAPDPQTACTQLIEAANTNGGEDNISAVIVFVR